MMKKAREEARAIFKHQVLFQDNELLLKETVAKKRRLQKTIEKKLKLAAEVKFLRRKYKSFSRNLSPSQETPYAAKQFYHKMSSPSIRFTQPQNSINKPLKVPSPAIRFAQFQNSLNSNELPLHDTNPRSKESGCPSTSALFDLNKVSVPNAEEMEWIQAQWEPLKGANDLNLSIFKDVGNGHSHAGKRKISWQDQVALRV